MKKDSVMKAVEDEEGRPFWDVVREYAQMGCSKIETSRLLGYKSKSAFKRLLRRHPEIKLPWAGHNQSAFFREYMREMSIPGTHAHRNQCLAGQANARKSAKRYWVDDIYDTARGHYARINPSMPYGSIRHRLKTMEPQKAFYMPKIDPHVSGRRGALAANLKKKSKAA